MRKMVEVVEEYEEKDVELIHQSYQMQFFENVSEEDLRKAVWLLRKYPELKDVIKNYEFVIEEEARSGVDEYHLSAIEGRGKKADSTDLMANIPESSLILKEQRHTNYLFYKKMTDRVQFAINNIRDTHQQAIAKLLFIEGKKYSDAQGYMEKGYKKHMPPISATTFADKRRKVIASLANSLKFNGTLDFVIIRYGAGRNEDGEIGLRIPGGV